MPRWLFRKTNRRAIAAPPEAAAEGIVEERPVAVPVETGMTYSFPWTFDPFFRPTVGLYVDGQLSMILPTKRRQDAGTHWICRGEIDHDVLSRLGSDYDLRCLETSQAIRMVKPERDMERTEFDVGDLIALSQACGPAPDCSGFPFFLSLPSREQISLVYHGVFGRRPADQEEKRHVDELEARRLTILDIRDILLESDEFTSARLNRVTLPYGHWLVWPGLERVKEHLLPSRSHPERIDREAAAGAGARPNLASHLAQMALGTKAPEEVRAAWLEAHGAAISDVEISLRSTRMPPASGSAVSASLLDFGDILGDMRVGAGGLRADNSVIMRPGVGGDVLYGPNMALASGFYALSLTLDAARSPWDARGRLTLEVVFGDILLAARVITAVQRDGHRLTLPFTIPSGMRALIGSGFEFRLRTDGEVEGKVHQLVLHRLGRTGQEAPCAPAVDDWLQILSMGSGCRRVAHGLMGDPEQSGHMFFGPYRALLPGHYCVSVELSPAPSAMPTVDITLDVMDTDHRTLAVTTMPLENAPTLIELRFDIREPDSPDRRPVPLEFRLFKPLGVALVVTQVRVSLT